MESLWNRGLNRGFPQKIVAASAFVILAVSMSACGDKTTLDEQQELRTEQINRLQPAAGTYAGYINSTVDGKSLGTLQMSLIPDTTSHITSDGTGTAQQASMKGSITYNLAGSAPVTVTFSGGDYEPADNSFATSFTIVDQAGKSHSVDVHGIISGNNFSGSMTADNYNNFEANFNVTKNGNVPAVLANQSAYSQRARAWSTTGLTYPGSFTVNGSVNTASLTLTPNETDPSQLFLNILTPTHQVAANINIGTHTIVFPAASTFLDDERGTINGTYSLNTTTGSFSASLNCTKTTKGGYACTMTSGTGSFVFNFNAPVTKTE